MVYDQGIKGIFMRSNIPPTELVACSYATVHEFFFKTCGILVVAYMMMMMYNTKSFHAE
jgi:hypothetical protein